MKQKKLTIFFIITILLNIAANLAHPVTPTIIKNLNLNDYMFGAAYGAMMFSNFLFSPFWGKRNEFRNSRSTMMVCCIGYAMGQMLFAISKTEGTILCARVFSGTFAGGIFVSFLTYLVHVSEAEERGKNMAVLAALQSIASAFGYFIGGMLGELSIFLVFCIQAGMLLMCGILFRLICIPDLQPGAVFPDFKTWIRTSNPFTAFGQAKRFMNHKFMILFSICGLAYLGCTSFEQCFNYYIKDIFGLTSGYNGSIKAAIGIVSLIANATVCLWIMKRTNVAKSTVFVLLTCTVSIFLVTITGNAGLFVGLSIFFFAVNAIVVPITQDMVSKEAAKDQGSIVMGFYNGMKSLGGIFGALIAGALYTKNPIWPIAFGGIAYLAATFCAGWFVKMKRSYQ